MDKKSTVHKVSDTVKVDPKEEYANISSDRMTVIHYKRLVVPANMRSIYWKCYGFPANEENEILTKTKIVCLLCKTQISYNRNTSNLRMHLQNKHKQELETLELVQPLPHSKSGSADKRTNKRSRKHTIKQEQVMQVYPVGSEAEQCFSGDSRKSGRTPKEPNRYGEWVVSDDQPAEFFNSGVSVSQLSSGTAQYLEEVGEVNPLRVIVKEATSNQSYALVDGKIIAEAIADFIILDLQSPEVVEGKGFQRLLATLKSPCEIPSKARLNEDIIPKMYETVKDHLLPQISALKSYVSLSIEDWISTNGDTYSTVSLHYISENDSELQSKILTTIYCSDVDLLVWGTQFDSMIEEWDIKVDKVRAVIVSSERDEVHDSLLARNYTIIPCLSHTLQQACVKACFEDPEVVEVLQKCRAVIALINRNHTALHTLRLQENLLQLEDTSFCTDNTSSWLSTFGMLEQISARKPILANVLETLSNSIGPTNNIELTESQWQLVDDLISVLSPFKVTLVTLAEEKSPLISILKPILWQLLNVHLQKTENDSPNVLKFKSGACDILMEKYRSPKVNEILDLATILDPRFKTYTFMNDKDKPALQNQLKELLMQQANEAQNINIKQEQLTKKQRLSGMEFLLGELCVPKSGMPARQRVEVELVQYECEAPASLEKSPIDAWKELQGKCSQLSKLAVSYLCAPACALDHLTKFFQLNPVISSLPPSLAHKLKFLHTNYNPIGGTQEHE